VSLPPNAAGKLDVGRAVGKGILAVVRNSKYAKQPYTGLVQITSGEIAEDVAMYLADSEQTPSALGVGVYVADSGSVTAAGGFLVQMLPGATEETIAVVERNVQALPSPTDLVRQGKSADDICSLIMDGLDPISFAASSPRYACKCSLERVKRTVALIPELEVYDLLAKQGRIEALCEFCGRTWHLERPEIETLFKARGLSVAEGGGEEWPADGEGEM
jgi:molecular chaperone Hsp33